MPGRIDFFSCGILSWVTWLPAIGAIFLLFFNRAKNDRIRWFANLWIGLCFLISIPLVTGLGTARPDSYGLRIMRERAERIGAQLRIEERNAQPGAKGTRVAVTIGEEAEQVGRGREAVR